MSEFECKIKALESQIDKREDDYRDLMNRSDKQIEGLQKKLKDETEFSQILIDANEQYIKKNIGLTKDVLKLKILVEQERYENQENKLANCRFSRSHERVMEEASNLRKIAISINNLLDELKEMDDED